MSQIIKKASLNAFLYQEIIIIIIIEVSRENKRNYFN